MKCPILGSKTFVMSSVCPVTIPRREAATALLIRVLTCLGIGRDNQDGSASDRPHPCDPVHDFGE